jgi:hypothetical protein
VSSCRRRKKERLQDKRENRRSATSPRAAAEASDLPPNVPALLRTRLNGKAVPLHHTEHYPGKRIRPRKAGALPLDPAQLKKLRERENEIVRRCPRRELNGKKGGLNGNTQTTVCGAEKHKKSSESRKEKANDLAPVQENAHRLGKRRR